MTLYRCDECSCETTHIHLTKRDEQLCHICIGQIHPTLRAYPLQVEFEKLETFSKAANNLHEAFINLFIVMAVEIKMFIGRFK